MRPSSPVYRHQPQKGIRLFFLTPVGGRVVCEAEPISLRGVKESNTVLDIAFGHLASTHRCNNGLADLLT